MRSLGSVTFWTSSGVTPGATSRSSRPCGVTSITASSLITMFTHFLPVSGRRQCLSSFFEPSFATCSIATITRLAPETRSMAPPIPLSTCAARAAICSRVSGMSGPPQGALLDRLFVVGALEDPVHVDRRDVDVIAVELAHLQQVLHLHDGDAGRGAHHRAEVAGGLAEDQVPPLVALPGAHDGEVGLEGLLEDHLLALENARLLALGDLGARAGRREEAAQARPAGADALGEGALRVQLDLQLAGEE